MSVKSFLDSFSPEEIVQVLSGAEAGIDYPHLDMLLTQTRSPSLTPAQVLAVVTELLNSGVIVYGVKGGRYTKGPQWTAVDTSRLKS
ncbi:MAG: hypothetical protein ACRYF9_23440 [Janthinobacterium lividum]|uniref:hypothetical protein n=1 Tax=Pseudomonas TaxID=286 RepID=UPI001CF9FE2F|nr:MULTISPECIES: hypothetical protein [Pseudomonas]